MTFEELLSKACTLAHLPYTARAQLPGALSNKTKEILLEFSPEEIGRILTETINEVNNGSVKNIDALVRELLGE